MRWLLIAGRSSLAAGTLWQTRDPTFRQLPWRPLTRLQARWTSVRSLPSSAGGQWPIRRASVKSRLAAGQIDSTREVDGGASVTVASTGLVSESGLAGFHAAFAFIGVLTMLGVSITAVRFMTVARIGPIDVGLRSSDVDIAPRCSSVWQQGETLWTFVRRRRRL